MSKEEKQHPVEDDGLSVSIEREESGTADDAAGGVDGGAAGQGSPLGEQDPADSVRDPAAARPDPTSTQAQSASDDSDESAPEEREYGDDVTDVVAHIADLEERIEELKEENSELKDRYLRKQADFENFRKRMVREKEDSVRYANQQILLDLTTIIDDFERAIRSADDSQDFQAFHDGVVIIENQLTGTLDRKWGLKRFDSAGEEFDPQRHEAVAMEADDQHETSVVLEEYQKGYLLNDRVLRSAKVKVSTPGAKS